MLTPPWLAVMDGPVAASAGVIAAAPASAIAATLAAASRPTARDRVLLIWYPRSPLGDIASGRCADAVGRLEVLEEPAVHAQLLLAGRDLVPDAGARAEPGRARQFRDHAAGLAHAGLARVEHHDPGGRDGEDPVAVKAEEQEHAGQGGEPLTGGLGACHGLDRFAGVQELGC